MWESSDNIGIPHDSNYSETALNVVGIDVQVPFWWQVAGFIGGKKPEALIETNIREQVARLELKIPDIDHVKVAFQGASFDNKGGAIILRVRSDALIDSQAITTALANWDELQKLSIKFP